MFLTNWLKRVPTTKIFQVVFFPLKSLEAFIVKDNDRSRSFPEKAFWFYVFLKSKDHHVPKDVLLQKGYNTLATLHFNHTKSPKIHVQCRFPNQSQAQPAKTAPRPRPCW